MTELLSATLGSSKSNLLISMIAKCGVEFNTQVLLDPLLLSSSGSIKISG